MVVAIIPFCVVLDIVGWMKGRIFGLLKNWEPLVRKYSFPEQLQLVVVVCLHLCYQHVGYAGHRHIKYSLDFLHPIKPGEAFEAVDWLADLFQ